MQRAEHRLLAAVAGVATLTRAPHASAVDRLDLRLGRRLRRCVLAELARGGAG